MNRASQSLSLRWRLVLPLLAVFLIVAMVVAYLRPVEARSAAQLQMLGLLGSSVAAAVIIVAFLFTSWVIARISRVREAAEALASGDFAARTGLKSGDEIGRLGQALDRYADYVQERHDALRLTLRRQRREIERLTSVLEAMPDGVIVLDSAGAVLFMNDMAKTLINAQQVENSSDLKALTAAVTDVLGPSLAPGLYALGDPRLVETDSRMLTAQAAALLSLAGDRVGTVIVLRDSTEEVRRERAREALYRRLALEVEQPLARATAAPAGGVEAFARAMSRHAVALNKLLVELREVTAGLDARPLSRTQRPIALETLIWAVANEWRQVAQASNLRLDVQVQQAGLYVLGDERRLRWAIGNLVDNAIKYTPPGGAVSIEIKTEQDGMARLRIRDNGVGISPADLPNVFTRFYRGTPMTPNGRLLRVPGTGQGLATAKAIIESHGGSIQIKSKVGVGTAVYFTLPLTAPVSLALPQRDAAIGGDMDGETVRIKLERRAPEEDEH